MSLPWPAQASRVFKSFAGNRNCWREKSGARGIAQAESGWNRDAEAKEPCHADGDVCNKNNSVLFT